MSDYTMMCAKCSTLTEWPKPCPKCSASSAQAPVENAGPVSSFALARGSLRVPAAPLLELLAKWEQRSVNAAARQQACTQEGDHHWAERFFDRRCAFDARIVELRRAMGLSDRRQPEENHVLGESHENLRKP